jgi:hypothetical protein
LPEFGRLSDTVHPKLVGSVKPDETGVPLLLDALDHGELEKVVLTQRNQMRAVVVSLERSSELERKTA